MAKSDLKIRLREQVKIYRDSPSVAVTYIELARMVENLLETINSNEEPIGFKSNA